MNYSQAAAIAKSKGLVKFEYGQCEKCGGTWRYTSSKRCVKCSKESSDMYRQLNPERYSKVQKAWIIANAEYLKVKRQAYYQRKKERVCAATHG